MFQARRLDFKGSPSCQRTCDSGRWINTYFCVITKQFVVPMPSRVNWSSFSEVCLNEKPKAIHLFMSFSENPGPSCLLNWLVRHKEWRLRPSVRNRWVGYIKIHPSDVTFSPMFLGSTFEEHKQRQCRKQELQDVGGPPQRVKNDAPPAGPFALHESPVKHQKTHQKQVW